MPWLETTTAMETLKRFYSNESPVSAIACMSMISRPSSPRRGLTSAPQECKKSMPLPSVMPANRRRGLLFRGANHAIGVVGLGSYEIGRHYKWWIKNGSPPRSM